MFKILWRSLTNRAETTPKKPLGPFRTDARVFDVAPESGLRVTWMGHSTMLIEIDGVRILTDPVWDERAAPMTWAGPKRFFAPPLKLEELPRIDAVLISHDHYDHLGGWTIPRLARMENLRNARWVAPLGVGGILTEMGATAENIDELDWTDSVTVSGLRITALPARHFSGRSLFNRFETLWASYALAGPRNRVYYGADSGEWDGFAEIASQYGPFDLTMLEIGASDPLWRQIHMGPEGALRSFAAMGGQGLLMPIHWGLFNLALHAWRQPIERVFAESEVMLWSPEPGLPTEVVRGVELRSEWWR
jgi:L-ascorbate metabolism protein UlaG (beta-lactamase superfamily)